MDFARYEFTLNCDHPEWLTDIRHVNIIYEFLMANDFQRVLEIGSYSGVSTAAFIEAINQGKDFKFHISEPNPTRQLQALISMCKKPDNIILHTQLGEDVLSYWRDFDFAFVDGSHDLDGAGAELLMLLRHEIPNVMAHDTNLSNIKSDYSGRGAELLARVFKSHKDYRCIEDKKERPNERTDRGFLFATREEEKYNKATKIFENLC